jgi:hypothetical protein
MQTAAQDADLPESKLLLEECYHIFHVEIAKATERGVCFLDIRLSDFDGPDKLLRPPEYYQRNVAIQHTTLYLVQILRYIRFMNGSYELLGAAGFCAGLLPAAVAATSSNTIEFLSRARIFFYVALWLGIRSQAYRRNQNVNDSFQPNLPWSIIVHGLSADLARELTVADNIPV